MTDPELYIIYQNLQYHKFQNRYITCIAHGRISLIWLPIMVVLRPSCLQSFLGLDV